MAETVTFTVQLRDEMSSGLRQVRSELDTTANAATKLADASDPKHNGFNESAKQAKTLSDRVKDAAGSLKQAVTGSTAYKAGMEHVTGATRKALSTLDALREKAVSSSKTLASIDAGLSAAVTRARGALGVLGNTAGNVAGRVGQAFRGVGEKLAPAFNRVGEALNPVVSKARTVFDKISDVAQPAVQKTMTVFRGVADKLTTVFDRVKPKFPGIVEGAKQAGEKAGQVIKKGLTGVAVAGVAAAGAVAGVAFSKGFSRLKNIEQAQAKLTGLGHSAEGVAALMENANQAVKGTAFGLDEAAGTAATMAAAGVQAGQEMTDILTLVGDAATIGGSSMSEMGAIFGKVASKGKLDGEVMAQLMDRQIGILPDLAKFYNVTTEQAAKMVSKGQVTFEEFAIIMQDKVGGAAQKSGETFTGAMANMKAALGRIGATLLTPFFSQAPRFLTALTGIIDGAHNALKPVMERFGKAFEPLADSVLTVLEGFAENGVNGVMEQVGKLVPALAPLMGALGALASGPLQALVNKIPMLGNVAFTINPLAGVIGGLVVGVPELRSAFMELVKTVGGSLMEAFTSLAPAVGSLATAFTDVLGSAVKAVMPVINTLIEMIGPLLTGVIKAVVPIIGAVLNVVVNVVKALMPAVESIMKAVAPILALVGRLVTALLPVLNIVTGLVTLLGKVLVPVINVLAKVVAVVFPVIAKIIEVALLAVTWVVEKIVGLFQNVLPGVITWFRDTVVPWLTGVWEAISAGVVWLVQNIGPMFVALWHGMGAVVSWVWQNIIQPSWEAIKVGFNALAQFFVFVWQNILKPVFTGIGWVAQWVWQNILQPAWAGMKQWFASLIEDMRLRWETILKPVFNAVGAVFRWVWQNILQPAFTLMRLHWQATLLGIQLLWETILKPTFNNVGNAVRFLRTNVWDPAVAGMKRAWQSMGNGLQWVKSNIIDPVFNGIKSGVHAVANSFNSAKEAIGRYWGQIREKVASPIRFVIQTVYNKGLRPVWNGIASAVNMKNLQLPEHKLSFASGGVMPGYTPGRDVHKFYSPTGGLLELSGGETIFRPEVTKALGVKEVTQINAVAKRSGAEGVRDYLEYGGERAQAFNTGGVLSFDGGGVMPSRVQQAQAWARAQVGKPYIWGGVGPRGYDCCLVGETMVSGPDGVKRIDELVPGDMVYSFVDGRMVAHRVKAAWFSKRQDVYRVRTHDRAVVGSANHPFLVVTRDNEGEPFGGSAPAEFYTTWKRLDELKPGDWVVESAVTDDNTTEPVFDDGTAVSVEAAWLIGAIVGDGTVTDKSVRLCSFDDDRDRAVEVMATLSPAKPTFSESAGVVFTDRRLAEQLARLGLRKRAENKRVPDVVFSWPEEHRRAFLDGYCDADGHRPTNTTRHGQRTYSSISWELASQVRLLHIGLGDKVSNLSTNNREKPITIKGVRVKQAKPIHSFSVWRDNAREGDTVFMRRVNARKLVESWRKQFKVARVLDITPEGERDTFDIEVEESHNFIADGVVVHNSGFMSAITNYLLGQNPYSRRFATGAFSKNRGAGGFQPGMKSAFVIGVSPNTGRGIGHTAGTLGGMNVESYGGHGPAVGSGARGATDRLFPWQFYLPQAGGEFVGGGPGGGGGPVRLFDLNPLKKIGNLFGRVPDAGGWSAMLVGGLRTLLKGMVDKVSPLQWADGAVDAAVNVARTGSAFAQGQAWAVAKRLNPAEIAAMNYIVSKESSWNPRAKNPSSSASGLPQFIDATSRAYLGGAPASQYSPIQQLNGMDRYVRERWGGWLGALGQWKRHHWYKDGGVTLFDNGGLWPHGAVGMNMSGSTEMALTNEQRQLLTTAMGNVAAYTGEPGPGRLGDVNITLTGDVYGMDDLEQRLSGVVETLVEEIYREWEERR